jgi:hypothetical protein
MIITFQNDNDVIVYALEKIISYARNNQYIFLAQSVWWISSIIGLHEGLVIHINNLRKRSIIANPELRLESSIHQEPPDNFQESEDPQDREVSSVPKDLQEATRNNDASPNIHPDRINQVDTTATAIHFD